MSVERIDYDLFRNLLRDVLGDVAANGLPGRHHFYITFNTAAEGVQISDRLREKFPEQMTIVLQHQFWELTVTDSLFEVEVSFSGIVERLRVPFCAIVAFVDPLAQFALQYGPLTGIEASERQTCDSDQGSQEDTLDEESLASVARAGIPGTVWLDKFRKKII